MKRLTFLSTLCLMIAGILFSCSGKMPQKENAQDSGAVAGLSADPSKIAVCYFSATGTTEKAAKRIADLSGGTLIEIKPDTPYSDADLDWRDSLSRSSVEMRDPTSRPQLQAPVPDLAQYTVVFVGYPNWWNTHPTIINTFLDSADLKGKTIIPFMTSGGSDITNSETRLKEEYPTLTFAKGLLMNDVSDTDIQTWMHEVGL